MNQSATHKESYRIVNASKLFGLSQLAAGALIGIGLFVLLAILFWITKFGIGFVILMSPGLFTRTMLSSWLDNTNNSFIQNAAVIWIIFRVSSIPPAILGMLFVSKEKAKRTIGIFMLMLYLVLSTVIGLPIYASFST